MFVDREFGRETDLLEFYFGVFRCIRKIVKINH